MKVISSINSICRSFLWFGNTDSHKLGMVNWKTICKPKKVGGLGIRNLCIWNQSAVGKIVEHIYMMKDSLWVRWVNGVYTKGGNWEIFNAPITASSVMKKIYSIKDTLRNWIFQYVYSIKAVYLETFKFIPQVRWRFVVWNRVSIPRHQILLLAYGFGQV